MATIKEQILNYLGDDTEYASTIADIYAIIEDSIFKTASMLPPKMLVQSCEPTYDLENLPDNFEGVDDNEDGDYDDEGDTPPFTLTAAMIPSDGYELSQDDIILMIERTTSSIDTQEDPVYEEYMTRFVDQKDISFKHQTLDTGSIYFATDYSPVFWLEAHGTNKNKRKIFTAPKTPAATIYTPGGTDLNYLDKDSVGLRIWKYTRQEITENTESLSGIPNAATGFTLKAAALAIIDVMIANQATSEEDPELFQLLGGLKKTFEEDLSNELKLFRGMWQ